MRTGTIRLKLLGIAAAMFVLSVFAYGALATGAAAPQKTKVSSADRADIITIDRQGAGFEKRSKVPVTFLHDLHTTKLGAEAADCAACHGRTERDFFDWNMKGTTGAAGEALRDAYHNACVSCHQQRTAAGKTAGPAKAAGPGGDSSQCVTCHAEKLPFKSIAMQVRMPLPLHGMHNTSLRIPALEGQDKNCSNCHHTVVDKTSGALILEKGKEQPCFTCHLQEKKENTPKAQVAAHQTCLSCHVRLNLQGAVSGPSNCSTCHAVPLVLERKYADGPRLERGQPDMTFIFAKSASGEALPSRLMTPALFNHALHEGVKNQCSFCHHQRVDSCGKCHTVNGEARAKFVTLYQAGHTDDPRAVVRLAGEAAEEGPLELWSKGNTCTGCHKVTAMSSPECAGCHRSATAIKASPDNCVVCHVPVSPELGTREGAAALAGQHPADKEKLALQGSLLRESGATRVNPAAMPEEVRIGLLADEYKPALFPHRKLVQGLLDNARESRLAGSFHQGDLRLCAGCHHNSTPSLNPPSCGSCHSQRPVTAADGNSVSLKAAYHQRCMSCHESMSVQKPAHTDCAGCHAAREEAI